MQTGLLKPAHTRILDLKSGKTGIVEALLATMFTISYDDVPDHTGFFFYKDRDVEWKIIKGE